MWWNCGNQGRVRSFLAGPFIGPYTAALCLEPQAFGCGAFFVPPSLGFSFLLISNEFKMPPTI